MKQLFTLLLFVIGFSTQSYAVNTVVSPAADETETVQIDYKKHDGFIAKTAKFVATKVNKIKKALGGDDDRRVLLLILAWFIPPVAVYMYEGNKWTNRVTLNLILTLLCGLPGIIHAFVLILGKK